MRISDWSSDVCSSDLFGLLLKDDEPVRILERRDGPGRLVIVVQRLGRGDQRSAIFAAGARIGFDEVGHRAAAQHLPRFIEEQGLRRSEEHTSELQSLMRISYAVFCLKKKNNKNKNKHITHKTIITCRRKLDTQ